MIVPPSGIASRALTARLMSGLLELAACRRARDQRSAGQLELDHDVPPSRRPEHRLELDDGVRMSTTLGWERLRRANASSWRVSWRGPLDDVDDRRGVRRGRRASAVSASISVAKPPIDRERVVEVVGDAARERPIGLHLLGVGELRLERDPLGHVDELARDPDRPAVGGRGGRRRRCRSRAPRRPS